MFPMMWSQPPCMNIEVRIVTHHGGAFEVHNPDLRVLLGPALVRAAVADDRLDARQLGARGRGHNSAARSPGWISR